MAERGKVNPLNDEITTEISILEGHQLVIGGNLAAGSGSIVFK